MANEKKDNSQVFPISQEEADALKEKFAPAAGGEEGVVDIDDIAAQREANKLRKKNRLN